MKEDICRIVKSKDEKELKEFLMEKLSSFLEKKTLKDELSFIPDCLETIPLELGWNKPYEPKDKLVNKTLSMIDDFDQFDEKEARKIAAVLLEEFVIDSKIKND